MNKKLMVAALATGVVVMGSLAITNTAFAAEDNSQSMMHRFAQRLGISTEERLENAVNSGTITEEQKVLVEEKQTEVQETLEDLRSADPVDTDAIHDVMEETREWAEENDVPAGLVNGGIMRQGKHNGDGLNGEQGGNATGLRDGSCLE